MNALRITAIALMAMFAAACTQAIDEARNIQPKGFEFNKILAEEYKKLAIFENDQMEDWPDAEMFAKKAIAAANANNVLPEELGNWKLPEGALPELTTARERLMAALGAGARFKAPKQAAMAQAKFDCWVEQQEENFQFDHIEACKGEFYLWMAALEDMMAPKPAPVPAPAKAAEPAPEPKKPGPFRVYFDHDMSNISSVSDVIVNLAAKAANGNNMGLVVVGHTDRSGDLQYNLKLSLARANAVKDALVKKGIAADRITINGAGETQPAKKTSDGIREAQNRRAVISFR